MPADNRRLEVVVDGFPLFGGVQLAVDTTLVSAVQGDGVPRRGAARTFPSLWQQGAQARLVVLAMEGGGRWSQEAGQHVCQVARKGQGEVGARCGATPKWSRRGGSGGVRSWRALLHAPLQVLFLD